MTKDVALRLNGRLFNLYDSEEMKAAFKAGMPEQCSTLVGETVRMALKIIFEEQEAIKVKQYELPVL